MALRLLLVTLVAGLGLELPSGDELAGWAATGREWVGSRMADLTALAGRDAGGPGEVGRNPAPGDAPATVDLAFDVVVEGMASDFAADLAASRVERATPEATPDAIAEGGRGVDPTSLAWSDPEPAPVASEVEATALPPAPSVGSDPARVERLSAAIRLTRQALDAWASLIEGSPGTVAVVR